MSDDESRHGAQPEGEKVRRALMAFADLIRSLDAQGRLADSTPLLLSRLGDLRQLLFDYEVRFTERLLPVEDPAERESRRIVREALERQRELLDHLEDDLGFDEA